MRTTAILLLTCFAPFLPAQSTKDWLQFRGPRGQGVSADKGVPTSWSKTEGIAWKTELPGAGASSPVLIGEKVFLTCYSGFGVAHQPGGDLDKLTRHIVRVDRATGKVVWTKNVQAAQPEQKSIRENHGYASSTPAVDEERLYVFFGKSGVFAFDHDGKQLWHTEVGSRLNGWGSATSPILYKDTVIVNASIESDTIYALDRKTGKEKWKAKNVREAWNVPVLVDVGGKTELVVAVQGKVLAFDPDSGEALWSCATDIGWYMVPTLVAHEGIIYCTGGRSQNALAIRAGGKGDVTKQNRVWTLRKGTNVPSPIYHEGHMYFISDTTNIAYCVEAKTGKVVYEERLERAGQVYASPVLADGKLYYVARDGRTFVLAAGPTFKVLATNDLRDGSAFNSTPAIADGRLYLRSDKFLYCLGGK